MKNLKYLLPFVQIRNPKSNKWVLINIELPMIISSKKTPYKNVKIVRAVL